MIWCVFMSRSSASGLNSLFPEGDCFLEHDTTQWINKQVREQLIWIHKKVDQDKGLKYTSNILHAITFHKTVIFKAITMTASNILLHKSI